MSPYDVVIVGAGAAGLTAGLYAGRARLSTLILDQGLPGGQLLNSEGTEDYPGLEAIDGRELATRLEEQTRKFGVEIAMREVLEVAAEREGKRVVTADETYLARAVIITAGGKSRKLDVPGEAELAGLDY